MEVSIRQEVKSDHPIVFNLIEEAFAQEKQSDHREQFLVVRLRKSNSFIPELSLIAEKGKEIIGHLLMTKIQITNEVDTFESLALAPVCVIPKYQKKGIGTLLIKHAHIVARELGYKSVVLIGHSKYYPRFGYKLTKEYNIDLPFEAPDENCMALELIEGGLNGVSGIVKYPAEFWL